MQEKREDNISPEHGLLWAESVLGKTIDLSKAPTCDLQLARREGIKEITILNDNTMWMEDETGTFRVFGPARILINRD